MAAGNGGKHCLALRCSANDGATAHLLTDIPFSDLAAYLFWSNAFYGGLYTAGYLLARRAGWQRASLAEQRRVRSEADGALREAQLVSLRGQLQPDLLIEALTVLQERYATDGTQGDELFDRLIGFLRAAMPGVRSGGQRCALSLTFSPPT